MKDSCMFKGWDPVSILSVLSSISDEIAGYVVPTLNEHSFFQFDFTRKLSMASKELHCASICFRELFEIRSFHLRLAITFGPSCAIFWIAFLVWVFIVEFFWQPVMARTDTSKIADADLFIDQANLIMIISL